MCYMSSTKSAFDMLLPYKNIFMSAYLSFIRNKVHSWFNKCLSGYHVTLSVYNQFIMLNVKIMISDESVSSSKYKVELKENKNKMFCNLPVTWCHSNAISFFSVCTTILLHFFYIYIPQQNCQIKYISVIYLNYIYTSPHAML